MNINRRKSISEDHNAMRKVKTKGGKWKESELDVLLDQNEGRQDFPGGPVFKSGGLPRWH